MKEIEKLDIDTDMLNIEIENDKVSISIKEKENHTLGDLRQKIINYLYNLQFYGIIDVEIMKLLFETKDKDKSLSNKDIVNAIKKETKIN